MKARLPSSGGSGGPRFFRFRRLLRFIEHALAIVGAAALVYHGTLHLSVIASASMAPTLQGDSPENGDMVLSERVSFWLRAPRRWELVAFHEPEQEMQIMKRVVGLPGEKIAFDQKSQVFTIDGTAVTRPASLEPIRYFAYGGLASGKTAASESGYYVLGDYSADSQDSRWVGPVDPSRIFARPWLIVWPPSRIRFVNPG
jgi:signal peptidase I